ncbi:MAG: hypothetical protein IPN24_13395 [Betaproteobacteria bacterium]|nr:hypothetical protein [Betaproteobacteria bacterium]
MEPIDWRRVISHVFVILILMVPAFTQAEVMVCGNPFENHYGPFDYRTATKPQRDIVERHHFTADVATLKRGASTIVIGADISYTLQVFPNHPRALMAMADLARREKTSRPKGSAWDIDCWFTRAMTFRPDDVDVQMIRGINLLKDGKTREAIDQFELLETAKPNNANLQYNLGLAYFAIGDYDRALSSAKMAYALGFPLPGLRNMLQKSGNWR